jgi:hypothetical protein
VSETDQGRSDQEGRPNGIICPACDGLRKTTRPVLRIGVEDVDGTRYQWAGSHPSIEVCKTCKGKGFLPGFYPPA